MITYGLGVDRMEKYDLTEKEIDVLYDWNAKDFIEFLESIDDYTHYVYQEAGSLKLFIGQLIKEYYVFQERYKIIDDTKNEQWIIIDRLTRIPFARFSYHNKDKWVVRDYRVNKWLRDLNSKIVELG